ncbi:probable disease resistance protein At4g27220 isoform X2 [Mangifera indica]|uniref:probable disease resistance protein At4g27220 isoform X2 n=1 Tax=Mangifera indica TaxID=29780 RepID=UPI001CFBD860|nr:probable disease resistance protein At4g27220 isoform X2 [Mangifera indica]
MVDCAGSIGGVLSPVLEVGKWLAVPIWRQFKYLYNYSTNFKKLEKKVEEMTNTRNEVQHKVTVAERNVEEITPSVKGWLKDVEKTITEAEQLIQKKANNPRCFNGLWSNYKQSKKAFKLIRDDIDPLLQQKEKFGGISFATIPEDIRLVTSEDYLVLESRTSIMKNVWDALNDENVYTIGVYGMGGIGKTTLVQKVGGEAKKLFEDIVFVEVTQNLDIKRVQTEISDTLGVKCANETERANKLYQRLRSGKKILLILDNIWEDVDLKTIGIPSKADRGGCKLMFTTRDLHVLEKMGSMRNFNMGILAEKEAWDLFAKMTGDVIQISELNSLANDVCKQCKGLPVVICAIAKALRTKTHPSEWKVALKELKAPLPSKFEGFLEKEYMKIALSYEYLRNDELKKTFLICSLMKNNASISDLFIHVVCLDILKGVNLTMEDARDRLDKLVRDLKDANLLLGEVTSKYFAMHDVIRDVAIIIAYVDHHVFTTKNDIERHWKNRDKLRKSTRISLPGYSNIIDQLWPDDLDCLALEYFYMPNSHFNFPNDFFKVMPNLKVLNLAGLHQSSLVPSICDLKKLQTLCLDFSRIEDVAIIGELKKLKVLSLKYSVIKELPIEIGQLTELRLLDLSYCIQLHVIVPNVILKLLQLEEFHIEGCPIEWKVEVLMELKLLSNLTSVELDVRGNMVLHESLFAKEPTRYKISIGNYWEPRRSLFPEYAEEERMLEVTINSIKLLEEFNIFKNVEVLGLAEVSEDKNYVEDSNLDLQSSEITPLFNEKVNFTKFRTLVLYNISLGRIWDSQISTFSQNLKRLKLEKCGKMTYVFPFSIAKTLRKLQSLEIKACEVLEKIVEEEEGAEVVVNSIFPQVTELVLINLPKLTILYPGIHASEFSMFKRLHIKYCKNLTSRYLGLQDDNKKGALPISENKINHNLEDFELTNGARDITWQGPDKSLTIWNDNSAYIPLGLLQRFQSVKKLELYVCEYKEIKSVSNLPNLEGLRVWHCTKLMSLVPSSASLQNLKVLDVFCANALLTLTTPSIARSLMQLRELIISSCEMLLEIIENEGDTTTGSEIVFDNLKLLSLTKLESLECFCFGNYSFNFSSLEELIIEECPNLKTFSRAMLNTPKLHSVNYKEIGNEGNDLNKIVRGLCKNKDEEISIDPSIKICSNDNSIEICYDQHPISFYQNLTHLILWNCGNIKYAFPPTIARTLHQLQQLKIRDCMALEEIVAKEEGANAVVNFVFPNVTILKLKNLPNLTTFYPEIHTLELPKLKELVVRNCDKCLSFKSSIEESEIDSLYLKAISLDNKINSHLEVFELRNGSAEITWQKQSKSLYISSIDESAYIPLGRFQRFHNLKELKLICCNYREIKRQLDLQSLEVLDVSQCEKLLSPLLSSTPSFQNLKVLKVEGCHGLVNLTTPSMARSLVQLRELRISNCEMLIEILENEGDAMSSSEQVAFNNLKKLSLKYLYGLSFFCSGNYSLNFPSMEELIIEECYNMKSFCQGMLSTPTLHKINYEREEIENEGNDLNSTIQQAHKEKIVQGYGKDCHSSKLQSHMVSVKKRTLKCVADYIVDVACKPAGLSHNYGAIFIALFSLIP